MNMDDFKFRVRHDSEVRTMDYQPGIYASEDVAGEVFDGIVEELQSRSEKPFTVILEEVGSDYMGFPYTKRIIRQEKRN